MKRNIVCIALMLVATAVLIVCASYVDERSGGAEGSMTGSEYTQYDFVMGTYMTQTIYGTDEDISEKAASEISTQIKHLDCDLLSWRSEASQIAKLNSEYRPNEEYGMDTETMAVLNRAISVCIDTDGALDITMRPLISCWGIENYAAGAEGAGFRVPDEDLLKEAGSHVGYEKISLTETGVTLAEPQMAIDLGAVGKGAALDYACYALQENGNDITGAVVTVGGSILVYGTKNDDTTFKIGIRNPEGDAASTMGYLEIESKEGKKTCISTSGGYEKYVEADGEIYHHIIDRTTLYPAASGLISVTVICEDGLVSDGLSTACFVLGYERSLDVLQKYNAEAIFIDEDKNVYVTDGIKDDFVITDDAYDM